MSWINWHLLRNRQLTCPAGGGLRSWQIRGNLNSHLSVLHVHQSRQNTGAQDIQKLKIRPKQLWRQGCVSIPVVHRYTCNKMQSQGHLRR
jgi:hypothetical protein